MKLQDFIKDFQVWRSENNFPKRDEVRQKFREYKNNKGTSNPIFDYILKQEKPATFLDSLFKKDSEITKEDCKDQILNECYNFIKNNNLIPTFNDIKNTNARKIFGTEDNLFENLKHKYQDLSSYILNEQSFNKNYARETAKRIKEYTKFIITTAVSNKKVNTNFLNSINTWCQNNNGLLLILPCADVANRKASVEWQLDPSLKDCAVIYNDTFLNNNLMISDIKMSAKHINPMQGLKHLCQEKSVIIASPKQEMEFIPNSIRKMAHCIMTTGAITIGDYENDAFMSKRTSKLAQYDHITGGIVIELQNNKIFHFRQIQADKDGAFIDLGIKYNPDGSTEEVFDSVMVCGDSHFGEEDRAVVQATKEMIEELNVSQLVMSDVITCDSISPWNKKKTVTCAIQSKDNKISLQEEAEHVANNIDEFADLVKKIIIPYSNHHVFLDRYIEEGRYAFDKVNLRYVLDIVKAMIDGEELPVRYMIEKQTGLKNKRKLKWLSANEDCELYGFEVSQHHLGANGAKGDLKTYRNAFKKSVSGHTHTARIYKSAISVGTNSKLELNYNKGLSNWSNTNCIIYPNSTFQLINVIEDNGVYNWRV